MRTRNTRSRPTLEQIQARHEQQHAAANEAAAEQILEWHTLLSHWFSGHVAPLFLS